MVLAATAVLAAAGCSMPTERSAYRVAAEAVRAHPSFPREAKVLPREAAELYVGKSAAQVLVAYEVRDAGGRKKVDSYTVWLSRIGPVWQVDRVLATPRYADGKPPAKS